VKTDASREFSR